MKYLESRIGHIIQDIPWFNKLSSCSITLRNNLNRLTNASKPFEFSWNSRLISLSLSLSLSLLLSSSSSPSSSSSSSSCSCPCPCSWLLLLLLLLTIASEEEASMSLSRSFDFVFSCRCCCCCCWRRQLSPVTVGTTTSFFMLIFSSFFIFE